MLRASINLGNAVLAGRDASGQPTGVTVDLSHALAQRLGIALELQAYDKAMDSVEAVSTGRADIGFFAIDPKRAETILFSPPYVLIEGCYLVKEDSPLLQSEEVDRPGHQVVVGEGSAYDLFLTRTLQRASLVRVQSSQAVVDECIARSADVAAGVREQLEKDRARRGGLRLLPQPFMVIEQAMGCSSARGPAARRGLSEFVEWAKQTGLVQETLLRHGQTGARVAPAASL